VNGHVVGQYKSSAPASDPMKYAIRNDTCLVIPGAQINPDLYVVYEKRLYAFATQNCVLAFKAAPNDYLPKER
jgi:hypothetical protein